jgi:hypothetical protein
VLVSSGARAWFERVLPDRHSELVSSEAHYQTSSCHAEAIFDQQLRQLRAGNALGFNKE